MLLAFDVTDEVRARLDNVRLRDDAEVAREEAELQKEHLFTLFRNAPIPIAILRGPDHVFELANANVCEMWGRTPEAVTPYQRAAQVWDERIGSARVQARNWRLMAFGCLLLSGGLAASLVWQSTQGTITPWVVEVDHLGQAQAVSPASRSCMPLT